MKVRLAGEKDKETILKLVNSDPVLRGYEGHAFKIDYINGYFTSSGVLLVCEDNDKIIGVIGGDIGKKETLDS